MPILAVKYLQFCLIVNCIAHYRPVSSYLTNIVRFPIRRLLRTDRLFTTMQSTNNNRNAVSRDDSQNGKSANTNRLFSVLKANNNAPKPRPAGAVVDRPVSAPVEAAQPESSGGGRKRNRSRGKNSGGEQGPNKVPASAASAVPDVKVAVQSTAMVVEEEVEGEKPAYLTDTLFSTINISENSKRALAERMKIKYMTQVQHESLPDILKGHDVLVKAKTGTGKTLAFLVPSIEVLIKERSRVELANRAQGRDGGRLSGPAIPPARILVLSPTRELAQQIVAEATALCTFHTGIGCVLLVGGTNMGSDVKRLNRVGEGHNEIIVATPGRMLAHLKETPGFAAQVKGVKVYIMDEADRLLDMGFKRDIDQITNFLNQRDAAVFGKRQTLLFSATVAPEIREIARHTLLPGYKSIDTVGEEVEQTHSHVPQRVMCAPLDQQLRVIVQLLEQHKAENPDGHKIIMFFATARQTGYYAQVLNSIGMATLEIHSRKSQGHRTRVSEEFRTGKNVILASSDVSARGMDYPDVTFVLQVGMTERDQYIHRLGRTARAGKSGTGLLLLAPFEYDYMTRRELNDLPLQAVEIAQMLPKGSSPLVARAVAAVQELAAREAEGDGDAAFGEDSERDGAKMAWQAWLGYYNSQCKKLNITKEQLVVKSAEYAATIGLPQIPALQKKTIGKMGLQGVAGLRIEQPSKSQAGNNNGGGRGGHGGGRPASPNGARPLSAPQQGQQQGGRGAQGGAGSAPAGGRGGGGNRGGNGGGRGPR